jgi:hypothetical protein
MRRVDRIGLPDSIQSAFGQEQYETGIKGLAVRWIAVPMLALACAPAWSGVIISDSPYAGTDAGSVDTLIGYGRTSNSDLSTEMDFVNYFAGTHYTLAASEKICDGSAACDAIIFGTDTSGVFAIALPDEPAYYLIKTGAGSSLSRTSSPYGCNGSDTGGGNDCDHFVFQNLASIGWGVFNFASMGFSGSVTSIQKISHVDQFGGTTQVSEPGSLALLCGGLLALGVMRRRVVA